LKTKISFSQRFHRLQWKLTLFYILTTVIVLLILEIAVVVVLLGLVKANETDMLADRVHIAAQNMGTAFTGPFINRQQLSVALRDWGQELGTEFQGYSAAMDMDQQILAVEGDQASLLDNAGLSFPPPVQRHIQTALSMNLADLRSVTTLIHKEADEWYMVAPIANLKEVRGALVVKAEQVRFFPNNVWETVPFMVGMSLVIFFIGAAIVGLAFGVVTSRSLVRRIKRLLASADRWSQGDFASDVDDPSGDELGQLAQRLNRMAKQLRYLLRARQDMATLEERNRLARELHDSVKQQMFALSIWVSNAKSLIGEEQAAARAHLTEAEQLIRQTQRELNALIQELRPAAMEGKDLASAIEDYALTWQVQTEIAVQMELHAKQQVLPIIEEAYFRILQEALTNIVKHSHATTVHIRLDCEDMVSLIISDNGSGFDVHPIDRERPGIGLISMRERVKALDGQLEVRSETEKGTIITIHCDQTKLSDIQAEKE